MKKLISFSCALVLMFSLTFSAIVSDAATPSDAPTAIQVMYSGNYQWRDFSEVYFDTLGVNMFTDPSVANFDGDTYPEYYDYVTKNVDTPKNPKAWWDRPALAYNGFQAEGANFVPSYSSANYSGFVCNDDNLSHTPDGSGVLKYTIASGKTKYIPLPSVKKYSYYVVTFWVKATAVCWDSMRLNTAPNGNKLCEVNQGMVTNSTGTNKWVQYAFLFYTGNKDYSQPAIYVPSDDKQKTFYFDDFGMYQLNETYGSECMTAGYMLPTPLDGFSSDPTGICMNGSSSEYNESYETIDWSNYGKNICPDSKVEKFDENGNYSTYFQGRNNYNVLDRLAQWDIPANDYQAQENNNKSFQSANDLGFVTADEANSHTNDGSGAIVISTTEVNGQIKPTTAYIALPLLGKYSYYAISFWIKIPNHDWGSVELMSGEYTKFPGNPRFISDGSVDTNNDCWQRVTFFVYTGSKEYKRPNLKIDCWANPHIDEVEVWKIEDEIYAEQCMTEKRLVVVGDVDNTLEVNSADIVVLRKELLNNSFKSILISDLNDDKIVNIIDLVALKKQCINV